jgi:CheY-like chemotaxis protein
MLFDVVMPVMGGAEAYHRIRELGGASIPLIFMTGYSSEVLDNAHLKENEAFDLGGVRIVQKPYTLDGLGRAVRDALDEPI